MSPLHGFTRSGHCVLTLFPDIKQLLDSVFVISRIIKVQVRVISRSRRLLLLFLLLHWQQATQSARTNLRWLPLEIMHRGHTWHDYPWHWHKETRFIQAFRHIMSMSVVRSCCFISLLFLMMSRQVNVLLQIIFLSLGSRPLIFTIYSFQKIVTVTFENVWRLAYETSSSVKKKCFGIQCLSPLFVLCPWHD